MLTIMTAMALAAAAQPAATARAANPHAQHMQAGQMDHSKMDHSKMDHSKMGQHGDGCCKKGADGKMECTMPNKAGASSDHQGNSGH
ncbi:MAG TPA: hypothetical protein VNH53_00745 [Sphingomicrobium sp.]|nr:hypothetical protein [Sphingomicrobium sp.]